MDIDPLRSLPYSAVVFRYNSTADKHYSERTIGADRNELAVVLAGNGVYRVGDAEIPLFPGVIVWLPAEARFSAQADKITPYSVAGSVPCVVKT